MWSRPIATSLQQAAAATRQCCKQLVQSQSTRLHAAVPWQQRQQLANTTVVCTAVLPMYQQAQQLSTQSGRLQAHSTLRISQQQQRQQQWHNWQLPLVRHKRQFACASTASTAAADPQAAPPAAAPAGIGAGSSSSSVSSKAQGKGVQTLDYTTLVACCHELTTKWVPSKVEEVCQIG